MSQLFEDEAKAAYDEQRILIKTKRTHYHVWKICDVLFKVLTLGKKKNFLTGFTTTVGRTIYFPITWQRQKANKESYVTLRHERKHVWRMQKLGYGNATIGFIIFCLLYFFVFLPTVLAWFRYVFEREAYVESYKAAKRVGLTPNVIFYVDAMVGPSYFWAWPFRSSVKKWFYKNCV